MRIQTVPYFPNLAGDRVVAAESEIIGGTPQSEAPGAERWDLLIDVLEGPVQTAADAIEALTI